MKTYTIQQFTSRNTASIWKDCEAPNGEQAENIARRLSLLSKFPVIVEIGVNENYAFSKYENGEKTAWSLNPLK